MARPDLVPTDDAARAIGVNKRTLQRWVQEGTLVPDLTTPGGHARWDVDRLRRELAEQARKAREERP
jgi:DNA-binding transcriptional MerR regulator